MKLLALLLALPFSLAASSADKLADFYQRHWPYTVDAQFLREVASETQDYADKVGQGDKVETMLAMWSIESAYDQFAYDGDSYGLTQTRTIYEKDLRAWWLARGVKLGSFHTPSVQVAFGVAEFAQHWYYARKAGKGRLWEAVMRYNGSGQNARNYANMVFKAREAMFGLKPPPRSKR